MTGPKETALNYHISCLVRLVHMYVCPALSLGNWLSVRPLTTRFRACWRVITYVGLIPIMFNGQEELANMKCMESAAIALLLKLRILDEGVITPRKQREWLGSNSGR